MNQPESLVTVVIPTRNRAELLRVAIDSVLSSPLITTPDQVIVVDDDSSDGTAQVVAAAGVRYLRVKLGGPAPVRNAGLALVETPYVAFLDDDDCWLPGNMIAQLGALEAAPDAAFAYGRFQLTDENLVPIGPAYPEGPLPSGRIVDFLYLNNIQLGTILFRTGAVREIGRFEEFIRFGEDQDLLLRLTDRWPAVGVECTGSLFRQRQRSHDETKYHLAGIRANKERMRRNEALGIRPSRRAALISSWRFRGQAAWTLCIDAAFAANERRRKDAALLLLNAVRLSPPHAMLRNQAFWKTAWAIARS